MNEDNHKLKLSMPHKNAKLQGDATSKIVLKASEANQTNRIKLLMTVAKDNLKLRQKERRAVEKENETKVKTTYREGKCSQEKIKI